MFSNEHLDDTPLCQSHVTPPYVFFTSKLNVSALEYNPLPNHNKMITTSEIGSNIAHYSLAPPHVAHI